jgi:hypothetical protein
MDIAELLREIGERLPDESLPRFTERCSELLFNYAVPVIEARSGTAARMTQSDREAFVTEFRDSALKVDYAKDRVRAVHFLCRFCNEATQRALWKEVANTASQESDYLSSGDLGISVSPRLDLFDGLAEMGPSTYLAQCLEAAVENNSVHSNGVVDTVLSRWAEVRALGRGEEIRSFTLLMLHGISKDRSILLRNLTRASSSLTAVQSSGFAAALQDVAQILE